MVRDPHLAKDVAQGVFVALAQNARPLASRPILAGWLHRTARNIAAQTVRTEVRRRVREQEAASMNDSPAQISDNAWEQIAPQLDDVLDELDDPDRDVLLLRYFQRKSAREMGAALGITDEAAQKRLNRAVERLREGFARRGVTVGTGGLVVLLAANVVQSAPAGLAVAISTAAAGTSVAVTTVAAAKTMIMTTLQKTLIGAAFVAAAGTGILAVHQTVQLRKQMQALSAQQAPLAGQVNQLTRERDEALGQLAALREENRQLNRNSIELLKLRGEAERWRQTATGSDTKAPNPPATNKEMAAGAAVPDSIGQQLGAAVVRGDAGALDRLTGLAKAEQAQFFTNGAGLDNTARGELARQTFAPLQEAFKVIEAAAVKGSQPAMDAVVQALQIPELKGTDIQVVGTLAANGDEAALDVLLNYNKYGFLLADAVAALRGAAGNGNQKAVDALSAVARDSNDQPLWVMVASGLAGAAEAGNATAVDALTDMAGSPDRNVRNVVISGLQGAAARQNAKAIETLHTMGVR